MQRQFAIRACTVLVAALQAAMCAAATGCSSTAADNTNITPRYPHDDVLAMHHVQVKGTHNSYHRKPKFISQAWNYGHAPLDVQLGAYGVRQFELDVYYNNGTGNYDVFHFPLVDAETTCPTLRACLQTMKTWSDANPGHLPLMIWVEPKDAGDPTGSDPPFAALEAKIDAIWRKQHRISPDDVRGASKDLATAVQKRGWPLLKDARGKAMFVMLDNGSLRDLYVTADPTLAGRLLFAEGKPSDPWGVIAKIDDPKSNETAIREAVKAGRMIRTRADSGSIEAKNKDYTRFEAALRSGAQAISTDHPTKGPDYDFAIDIPGGAPARCNPITAPPICTPQFLELL